MGVRFRRSVKLAKGVRLNFSKSGVGISAGVKGARVGIGPRGAYRSLGIPGTGIYMFDYLGKKKINTQAKPTESQQQPPTTRHQLRLPAYPNILFIISLFFFILDHWLGAVGLIAYVFIRIRLSKTPVYQAQKHLSQGHLHIKRGNPTEAITAYTLALEHYPDLTTLHKTVADLQFSQECFPEAAAGYEAYITAHPEDSSIKPKYAISLARAGQTERAIATLQSLPQELKEHPQIISTLGALFLETGQAEAALNVLKAGPTRRRIMDEDMMLFRYTLGLAYKENGDSKKALNQFQRVYAQDIDYLDVKEQIEELSL